MHQLFGIAAGILGTTLSFSYLAQTVRIVKRRSSGDISLIPVVLNIVAGVTWCAYATTAGIDWPLMAANSVAVVTLSSVLLATAFYRHNQSARDDRRTRV